MFFPIYLSVLFSFVRLSFCVVCDNVSCPPGTICENGACQCVGDNCPTSTTTTTTATTTTTSEPTVCSSNPCRNRCQCIESCKHANGYYCRSPLGFVGRQCDIPAPLLTCSSTNISISTEARLLDDLYAGTSAITCLYISSTADLLNNVERCRVCAPGASGIYNIAIPLPFSSCDIQQTTSNGEAVFAGVLWANLLGAGNFDAPVPVLTFHCRYNKQYTILASIKPRVELQRVSVKNTMQPVGFVELCKVSSSCPNACPPLYSVAAGAVYTVSQTIHATMSLEAGGLDWYRGPGTGYFVVILDTMDLSCGSTTNDGLVQLVRDGCETAQLTTFIRHDGDSNVVCVSFKVPRLLECPQSTFYIHARLRIVERSLISDCATGNGRYAVGVRSKRSLDSFAANQTNVVSVPIVLIDGVQGRSYTSLFPEKANFDELPYDELPRAADTVMIESPDDATSKATIVAAVLGGMALLLLVSSLLCSRKFAN